MRDPIVTEKSVLTKLSSDKSSEVISPKEQIPIREITFIYMFSIFLEFQLKAVKLDKSKNHITAKLLA